MTNDSKLVCVLLYIRTTVVLYRGGGGGEKRGYNLKFLKTNRSKYVFLKDRYNYRAVITWVYIGFVNRGFEILWCEYLWVATSPCPPQENLEI